MSYERLTPNDFVEIVKLNNGEILETLIKYALRLYELENKIETGDLVEFPNGNNKYAVVEFCAQRSKNYPWKVLSYHCVGLDARGKPVRSFEHFTGNIKVIKDGFETESDAIRWCRELGKTRGTLKK